MNEQIISRAEAKARGLKHYFTGKQCPNGHIVERYVTNGCCLGCNFAQAANRRSTLEGRTKIAGEKRKRVTGMPPGVYHQLLIDQAGLCDICDKQMMGSHGACADHDHNNPGIFRGLLCNMCNHDIAILENPERLSRAQAYLARHMYHG